LKKIMRTGNVLSTSDRNWEFLPRDVIQRMVNPSRAIAIEMESAVIALEAAKRGIPFACVRTILDTLDDEVIGAEVADEQGRVRPLRAAGFIVRHPAAIVTLGRIARNLGIATKSLADAIETIVRHTA